MLYFYSEFSLSAWEGDIKRLVYIVLSLGLMVDIVFFSLFWTFCILWCRFILKIGWIRQGSRKIIPGKLLFLCQRTIGILQRQVPHPLASSHHTVMLQEKCFPVAVNNYKPVHRLNIKQRRKWQAKNCGNYLKRIVLAQQKQQCY